MLISDWSSDVCSSDLCRAVARGKPCRAEPGAVSREIRHRPEHHRQPLRVIPGGRRLLTMARCRRQIGRASCRERQCQVAMITVIAEDCKKNMSIHPLCIHSSRTLLRPILKKAL